MRFFIFLLFLGFITSLSLVSATGFSPTSLTFNLDKNQKECQTITLTSDSETIDVYDKWAESKDVEWSVSSFKTESSSHGLSLTYPKELSLNERKVEVCISGSKEGEYHGVLLMKEEQKGNSIMQAGVWLKVLIGKETTNPQNTATNQNSNPNTNTEQVQLAVNENKKDENQQEKITETNNEVKTANGITGAAVGTNSGGGNSILIIIVILVAIGALTALFNYKRLQKRRMEYGY
jgi:hypothetical protein